jgi:hypothetical protein
MLHAEYLLKPPAPSDLVLLLPLLLLLLPGVRG